MNRRSRVLGFVLAPLIGVGAGTPSMAQQTNPDFQGMWSDPPTSPALSFCFVGCVQEAFAYFNSVLEDPEYFDQSYAELQQRATEYQTEFIRSRLTSAGVEIFPFDFVANDPSLRCQAWGLALQMLAPHQVQITQYDDRVEFYYAEWAARRTVYLSPRERPSGTDSSRLGYSVGHYEGNELVVETTSIEPDILYAGADESSFTHSDRLFVVERYTKTTDGSRLELVATLEDPVTLTEPLTIWKSWAWAPDEVIYDYECTVPAD